MKRIHIIGRKNSGKTTLVAELASEFKRRGMKVGTIKHTHHHHELDTPGKDSHRHREAGSGVVGILSRSMSAVFWPTDPNANSDPEMRYEVFRSAFSDCDIVLVEGDTATTAPKLEVWRAENQTAPLAKTIAHVLAIVTDDALDEQFPLVARSDIAAVADFIHAALK